MSCSCSYQSLRHLFKPNPVRCKEFTKNIKREYARLVALLMEYALICTGVKLLVTNQPALATAAAEKAPKALASVLLQTQGNSDVRSNLVNVYGAKQTATLLTVAATLDLGPGAETTTATATGFLSVYSYPCSPSSASSRPPLLFWASMKFDLCPWIGSCASVLGVRERASLSALFCFSQASFRVRWPVAGARLEIDSTSSSTGVPSKCRVWLARLMTPFAPSPLSPSFRSCCSICASRRTPLTSTVRSAHQTRSSSNFLDVNGGSPSTSSILHGRV